MDTKLFDSLTKGGFEQRLFSYMNAVGLKKITVEYSGGGDSGGMDSMSFHPHVGDKIESGIRETLEEELCSPIYSRHGSFADGGGYYVNGEVSYNSESKTVWISGVDHNTEYGDYNEETEEYENEETSDEEWEECVYSNDKEDSYFGGFDFVYLYARDFLKGKLPEEFHNRIVLEAATKDADEYANRYVREIK